MHVNAVLAGARGIRSPGSGVTEVIGYLLDMGAGIRT